MRNGGWGLTTFLIFLFLLLGFLLFIQILINNLSRSFDVIEMLLPMLNIK